MKTGKMRFDQLDNNLVDAFYDKLLDEKYSELNKMNNTSAIRYALFGFVEFLKQQDKMQINFF